VGFSIDEEVEQDRVVSMRLWFSTLRPMSC
jgi:hypothetical protein